MLVLNPSYCRNCQDRYGNARGRDLAMVRALALCRDAVMQAK